MEMFWRLAGSKTASAWKWWARPRSGNLPTEVALQEASLFHEFWYGTISEAEAWQAERSHLKQVQDDLRSSGALPGLLNLATNPFFLKTILQVGPADVLPDQNRGQLLGKFVDLLASQKAKVTPTKSIYKKPKTNLSSALASLAYEMQIEHKGTTVTMDWILEKQNRLPDLEEAVLLAAESANILDVIQGETVHFSHQLLQDYFVALKLGEKLKDAKPQDYWPGERWWEATGWEESAVLLAGLDGDSTRVVRWLMPVQPILAFRCATESGAPCDPETKHDFYEPPEGARISPQARVAWGRDLSQRGEQTAWRWGGR